MILAHGASGITARSSSTTSLAMIAVVNGPIRNEIGMSCGIGAMGPYNHANATIGRAYNLLSLNVQGGSVPDDTYMGTLGNCYNYNDDLRGERGAQPVDAVPCAAGLQAGRVAPSAFSSAAATPTSGYGPRDDLEGEIHPAASRAGDHNQPPLIVMDPIVARLFVDLGFDTKEKLIDWCAENAQTAGARILGRSVGADADPPACGRRRRAVCLEAQGRPERTRHALRAARHPYRRHRRRDAGRLAR